MGVVYEALLGLVEAVQMPVSSKRERELRKEGHGVPSSVRAREGPM